jgi:hypothetical protein
MKKLILISLLAIANGSLVISALAGTNAALTFNTNTWQIGPPGILASNAAAISNALAGIGFAGGSGPTNAVTTNSSGQYSSPMPSTNLTGTLPLAQLPGAVVTNNNTTNVTLLGGLNVSNIANLNGQIYANSGLQLSGGPFIDLAAASFESTITFGGVTLSGWPSGGPTNAVTTNSSGQYSSLMPSTNLTGTLPLAQLPGAVVTNGQNNVSLPSGMFYNATGSIQDSRPGFGYDSRNIGTNMQLISTSNSSGTIERIITSTSSTDNSPINPFLTIITDAGTPWGATNYCSVLSWICGQGWPITTKSGWSVNARAVGALWLGYTWACDGDRRCHINWWSNCLVTMTCPGCGDNYSSIEGRLGKPLDSNIWHCVESFGATTDAPQYVSAFNLSGFAGHLESLYFFCLDQNGVYCTASDFQIILDGISYVLGNGTEDTFRSSWDFLNNTASYWEDECGTYCSPEMQSIPALYAGGAGNSSYRFFDLPGVADFYWTNSAFLAMTNGGADYITNVWLTTYQTPHP